jgi:hypothetical protein
MRLSPLFDFVKPFFASSSANSFISETELAFDIYINNNGNSSEDSNRGDSEWRDSALSLETSSLPLISSNSRNSLFNESKRTPFSTSLFVKPSLSLMIFHEGWYFLNLAVFQIHTVTTSMLQLAVKGKERKGWSVGFALALKILRQQLNFR